MTVIGNFLISRGVSAMTVFMIEDLARFPTCGHYTDPAGGRKVIDVFGMQFDVLRAWFNNPNNSSRIPEFDRAVIECCMRRKSADYAAV